MPARWCWLPRGRSPRSVDVGEMTSSSTIPVGSGRRLAIDPCAQTMVYRIGYKPDPFAWTPWQYADHGTFAGRWDDPEGNFRTLYVADRLLGCLLEVLADFRPDLGLVGELDEITGDDQDDQYPTAEAGTLPLDYLAPRCAGAALMSGIFVDVRQPDTIAALRRRFGVLAASLGFPDLDAATIKSNAPRTLTQRMSSWFYSLSSPRVDGVTFSSRHGDELQLWAIYEQPADDNAGSHTLADHVPVELDKNTPALTEAMRIHGLRWSDSSPTPEPQGTVQEWVTANLDLDRLTQLIVELAKTAGAVGRLIDSDADEEAIDLGVSAVAAAASSLRSEVKRVLRLPPIPDPSVGKPFIAGLLRWDDAAEAIRRSATRRDGAGITRGAAALEAGAAEFHRAAAAMTTARSAERNHPSGGAANAEQP